MGDVRKEPERFQHRGFVGVREARERFIHWNALCHSMNRCRTLGGAPTGCQADVTRSAVGQSLGDVVAIYVYINEHVNAYK